jgi:hypothetical protein
LFLRERESYQNTISRMYRSLPGKSMNMLRPPLRMLGRRFTSCTVPLPKTTCIR